MVNHSLDILEGVTVLELSSVLAGPAVGMFLAELGARVIKVENPKTGGDVTRGWKLPSESLDGDISAYFSAVNWGKESIALDLGVRAHRDVLHKLVQKSDIVIQNFKTGVAERFEVDYASLKQINRTLIYAEITAYGECDPRPGFDAIIQAESGFTFINGEPDSRPTKMPVALTDLLTAHQMKEAILLALLRRSRTGEGSCVTVSLLRSAVCSLANQATNWLVAGIVPQRTGSQHPNIAPYGTSFRTADGGEFVLAVGTDRQFRALCALLAIDLAEDERFRTNHARVINREALNSILSQQFARLAAADFLKEAAAAGIPAGPINPMDKVFNHEEAKRAIVEGTSDDGVALRGLRSIAFAFEDITSGGSLRPPPRLNQDAHKILYEDLGLSETDAIRLQQSS